MKMLIADDEVAARKIMQKFLSQYGETDLAVDGLETLDLFLAAIKEKTPYQMVCLDIMMPKLDGLKVLKAMREIEKHEGIEGDKRAKVIMTTALNDKKTVMESYDSGCEAYAWKPIDLEKLKEVMRDLGLV